ncbi:AAA-ATPase At2g46620 [Macadamia integrifolia]|uniref:AAA-ATPase At2g46620 n=1 Tax=Macadamia integrifolia TaxID=60698 RepID=UPI001C4FF480|nr:AAA-ATPase At2g46620 [Macadamia integrifolia]XP_042511931.1 AAA-ATPase At2g46620 [Macadamia integrifolia]XP_042511932.1 AAA-ATPase At2g46620 [Macadamia integrifolia]XP_042511933.1 AAA-ATPase At2g46620 [Macadamia integrifolia]XP_042511934.1 AAA-ATPase At2g46620 [Macadamia integrifolia]XP_042511935.1 AAA-ATPase At2g46620 [Macadamia integrifolia]
MLPTNPISILFVVAGVFVLLRVFLRGTTLLFLLKKWWRSIDDRFHVYQFYKVPEYNQSFQENQLYRKVSTYLSSLASIEDSDFANLFAGKKTNDIVLHLDPNQTVHDIFLGARVSWKNETRNDGTNISRTFILKIKKRDKRRILRPYLQHIHSVTDEIEQRKKEVKLYTNAETEYHYAGGRWKSVPFTHPSTLDTVAMDSDLKNKVKSDLESFLKSKQYYHRLGRVWKRSYLLYGPSGTGKSSFVAAMAKFLCYDVYDVDLSKVSDDSDLKMLLLQTTSRSVIVIEDLDRFLDEKSTAVSLSGVLNFMDGIFSCCGEERVMVFTMTSKENIDPAILRPGRIDVHLHFPLCDFSAFKTLANSYLGLKDHKLFPQVEEIFQGGATLSQAEIGEIMIVNRCSPSRALKSVINALQTTGDGRRGSGKQGQRLSESASGSGRLGDDSRDSSGNGVICRESVHTVREFRKLYGLLRMRSSKRSVPFDLCSVEKEKEKEG